MFSNWDKVSSKNFNKKFARSSSKAVSSISKKSRAEVKNVDSNSINKELKITKLNSESTLKNQIFTNYYFKGKEITSKETNNNFGSLTPNRNS